MNYLESFNDVQTFIFDVDGVLAQSNVLVLEDGKLLRRMNTRDDFAIRTAVELEYNVAVITGGKSEGVVKHIRSLGVTNVYSGVWDKLEAYEEFIYAYDLDPAHILYMGDDLPDYDVMCKVGLPTCPQDAAHEIKKIARYISPIAGGQGCVRDVIEKVLLLHDKWNAKAE